MRAGLLLAVLLIAGACEGPIGPQGPGGPPGPEGPQGEAATAFAREGAIPSAGGVTVSFPGLRVENVLVNCWVGDPGGRVFVWVKVAVASAATCGAAQDGADLKVLLLGPRGWRYLIVVARYSGGG